LEATRSQKRLSALSTNISNTLEPPFYSLKIRQHFWITSGREAVKGVRRNFTIRRRNRAKPEEQLMGDLPDFWLDFGSLPFTRTAVDLFGPFEVVLARNRTNKRWGVLFIYMVTRAVFLELVPSLSTSDFLLALRKFISL
jgi:hypothetical protein